MDELVRGRKEYKRQLSGKRKTNSHSNKRPVSPKGSTFNGPFYAADQPPFKSRFMCLNSLKSRQKMKTDKIKSNVSCTITVNL